MKTRQSRTTQKTREPYASISASLLATKRLKQLSAAALKVWLFANARWTPEKGVGIPTSSLPPRLAMKRQTLCCALRELLKVGLLEIRTGAIRPGGAGSRLPPRCTTYHLPQRHVGAHQRFDMGDPSIEGMWRIASDRLVDLAAKLDDTAIRVFVCAVLPQPRANAGAIKNAAAASMTTASVMAKFKDTADPPSLRSIERAFASLTAEGLLRLSCEAAGRRAAVYEPAGVAALGRSKPERQDARERRSAGGGRTMRDRSSR